MNRRHFLKGVLLGSGATLGSVVGIKAIRGDYRPLVDPLGGIVDPLPEFQDVMKVILLGTGNPLPNLYRSKPALVVLAGKKVFLVDCGAGTVERLLLAGICPERIEDVFITHHHSDHNSGLGDFFITGWVGSTLPGRSKPLNLYGPGNTRKIISSLMDHLAWDIHLRILQAHNPPDGARINYFEMEDGIIYEKDGLKVTIFLVDHGIVKPAVGFRFDYRGKSIVISGDTLPCENILGHSQQVDLLVHEAYSRPWIDKGVKRFPEKRATAEGIVKYHSSTLEVAEIAKKADIKHLVLTHLIPSPSPVWYFERDWMKGVSDIYKGKVTVGRDLMVF